MTSKIKISLQREATVVPTVLLEGLNSFISYIDSPSLTLSGVNLKIINCNSDNYLRLKVKNATMVIMENCTFGDWIFEQVLYVSIKDCIAPKRTSRILKLQNTSGLIENITVKDADFFEIHVNKNSYIKIIKSKFVNNLVRRMLIFVSGSSSLEMSKRIVQNNNLRNDDYYKAGVFFSENSLLLINRTNLENNIVGIYGAVIGCINSTLTVHDSLLKNNTGSGNFQRCQMSIDLLHANKAHIEGGIIFTKDFSLTTIYNSSWPIRNHQSFL